MYLSCTTCSPPPLAGACCARCASGRPCESHAPLAGLLDTTAARIVGVGILAAFVLIAWRGKRQNPGPREWYVYSRLPGSRRADFVFGPLTESRARGQLTQEHRMGMTATMRKKRG